MTAALEQELRTAFPFMNKCCECGDGWFQLLYDLCQEITNRYEKDNKEVDIEVGQVKEKFGTLRFYYYHKDIDTDSEELRKDIEQIVRKYEKNSKFVCEMCGKEGAIRTDIPWIKTLCNDCCKKFE